MTLLRCFFPFILNFQKLELYYKIIRYDPKIILIPILWESKTLFIVRLLNISLHKKPKMH